MSVEVGGQLAGVSFLVCCVGPRNRTQVMGLDTCPFIRSAGHLSSLVMGFGPCCLLPLVLRSQARTIMHATRVLKTKPGLCER